MSADQAPPPSPFAWPTLTRPDLVRANVSLSLWTPRQDYVTGWAIYDGDSGQLVGLHADRERRGSDWTAALPEAAQRLAQLLEQTIPPF